MDHPYRRFSSWLRWLLLLLSLFATAWVGYQLDRHREGLTSGAVSHGIIEFELTFGETRAQAILDSWTRDQKALAVLDISQDFLFLLSYPLFLSLWLAALGDRAEGNRRAWYCRLSWLMLAMAPLDAVENLSMLQMLDDRIGATRALAIGASVAALMKFLILAAGVLAIAYAIFRGVAVFIRSKFV